MSKASIRQKVRESAFWMAYDRNRYLILFCALLLTLVLVPAATLIGLPRGAIAALVGLCLLAAIMPNTNPRRRYQLPLLILFLIALREAADYGLLPVASALVQVMIGLVGLLAAAAALRFAIRAGSVDDETIYASLSTYLLAGIFLGQIYWSIEQIAPGSMTGPTPLTQQSAIYYSFVTLATLGYGDILPRSDLARGIATLEVIGGQLYLAVMVARLIGLFGNRSD